MNVLAKGASSMRIVALPLARLRQEPHSGVNTNKTLVFYHFDLISPRGVRESPSWNKNVMQSVMNKATDIWNNLEKAQKGSWKLWIYELGERIANRIEFEELALRNVDPSIGPSISQPGVNEQDCEPGEDSNRSNAVPKIPLIYPPSAYPVGGADHVSHPSVAHLQALLASCRPRHRTGFYLWMLIAPLTTPIALIPVVPNLPFFFCVWRSWSHYRAYRSSQYLSSLLENGLIEPSPGLDLDKLYASSALSEKEKDTSPSVCMLLAREAIPDILEMFRLPETAAINVHRAMDQARGRLEKLSKLT